MELLLQYIGLGVSSVFHTAEGGLWLMPLAMTLAMGVGDEGITARAKRGGRWKRSSARPADASGLFQGER